MRRRQVPATQRTERIMSKPKSRTTKKAASKTAGAARPTSKLGQLQAMLQRPEGATRNGVAPEHGKDDDGESDECQHNCDPSPPGFVCCIYRPFGSQLEQTGKRDARPLRRGGDRGRPRHACISRSRRCGPTSRGATKTGASAILKNCYGRHAGIRRHAQCALALAATANGSTESSDAF